MVPPEVKVIAGPCSAESYEQLRATAAALKDINLFAFRAGIWKPRTRPGAFEGIGDIGVEWLRRIKEEFNIPVTTEVANPSHVEIALKAGIDILWIGARTTSNPFSVQELAESLQGVDIPIMVKNPTNPDLKLWLGGIERFMKAGAQQISAIHRGFSTYEKREYRNVPNWQIPLELRRYLPDVPLFCDPSHISGKSESVFEVAQKAMDLKFDGLMIETHNDPVNALTDARQQITPLELETLLRQLALRSRREIDEVEMLEYRALLGLIDEQIILLLSQRMDLSKKIGAFKRKYHLAILQNNQWKTSLQANIEKAKSSDLNETFSTEIFKLIHQESIDIQSEILGTPSDNPND